MVATPIWTGQLNDQAPALEMPFQFCFIFLSSCAGDLVLALLLGNQCFAKKEKAENGKIDKANLHQNQDELLQHH